ncbi:MAG: DUF4160 domain-containing protein [Spartobacteria bacterium]|nr:DUF4160 domain-containing protein [Spartobacteria bacterium]
MKGAIEQCQRYWIKMGLNSFYANEHAPRHIHVMNASGHARIELGTLRVIKASMRATDIKRALKIARANNAEFERKWDEYFNR